MTGPFADIPAALHLTEQGIWLFLKATLILGAAWGLAALFRRRSAAVRHGIWSVAMALLLALPLLSSGLPAWRVSLPFASLALHTPPSLEPAAPVAVVPVGPADEGHGARVGTALTSPSAVIGEEASRTVHNEAAKGDEAPSALFYVLIVWAGGAVLLLARLVRQLLYVWKLSRRAFAPVVSAPVRMGEAIACEMGIRRKLEVVCSDEVLVPVTWGLRRPVVMLPREAAVWPDERLRVVLLHELAHVRRWDYLTHLIAEVACALYWPNPVVWFARERVYAEQEQACDDRVLRSGTRSYEYAEHLLEIARVFQRSRRVANGALAMAREISLKDRIRVILDGRQDRHPLSPRTGLALTATLAGLALPLAALHPGAPEVRIDVEPELGAASEALAPEEHAPEPVTTPAGPIYLWLEAEEGILRGPMVLREDIKASSGYFAFVPDGEGNDAPEGGPGMIAFSVYVPHDGRYHLWGRVIGGAGNDNSFYVSIDGGEETRWDILDEEGEADVDEWTWLAVGTQTEPEGYRLTAGQHTIRIRNREDGTRIDRVLLTDDAEFMPEGRGPAPLGMVPVYLWIEAEDVARQAPMQADGDAHASGLRYVWVPRDRGDDGAGALRVAFEVDQPGRYVVWGRVIGPDEDDNSFYASMDGHEAVIWDIPGRDPDRTARRWTWDPISSRDSEGRTVDPLIFDLSPGRHVLDVRNREDGTKLDGILITNDLAYRPRGTRPAMPPAEPVFVWMEAEDARLWGKMLTGRAEQASGQRYIAPEKGSESLEAPPEDGQATFSFAVPEPGTYTVWGRVSVPDEGNNSFWVRVNGGAWVRWNEIKEGDDWHWDEVHDADYGQQLVQFELAAGTHTLEIAYREDGTKLDQLLVTNDPAFVPRDETGPDGRITVHF